MNIRLDAERRLTKVEKDLFGDVIGKIGEWTYRFNTPDEAKASGIRTFKDRFTPGWILVSEYNNKEILAET